MFDLESIPDLAPVCTSPGPHGDGIHAVFRFANNYGASVIRHEGSYGVELAVIAFNGPGNDDYELNYDTPVTSDVIGWIADEYELRSYLREVEDLPLYRPLMREVMSSDSVWEFLLSVDCSSREILEIEAVVYNDGYISTDVAGVAVEIEDYRGQYRVTLKS